VYVLFSDGLSIEIERDREREARVTVHVPSGATSRMIEDGRREAAPREPGRVSRICKGKKGARYLTEETRNTASHEEIAWGAEVILEAA